VSTLQEVAIAMIEVTLNKYSSAIIEVSDIKRIVKTLK
jgi:hypothetical protein